MVRGAWFLRYIQAWSFMIMLVVPVLFVLAFVEYTQPDCRMLMDILIKSYFLAGRARPGDADRTTSLGNRTVTWYALACTSSIARCGGAKLKLSRAWRSCNCELHTVWYFRKVPPIRIGWFVWRSTVAVTSFSLKKKLGTNSLRVY